MAQGRVPNWVWAALLGVHVLALAWALHEGTWEFPDSGRYMQAAGNLRVHGELYARPWPVMPPHGQAAQEFTIRPIGYPLMVLGVGVGSWPVALLVVQNLLSLLNIGLVLSFWARWAHPKTSTWGWGLLAALSFPAQFIYANAVMSEMLLQTVVLGAVGAGLLFISTGKSHYFASVAGALALACLVKPVFYPLAVGAAAGGGWVAWWRKRPVLGLWAVVPLVVVVAYMGWNKQRTGYFHFSSIAEINMLHYNAAGVVRQIEGPVAEEHWVATVLRAADAQPDFSARQELIQTRAWAMLWAHPVVYACQHLLGMAALFFDPGRFDVSQFLGLAGRAEDGLLAQARAGGLVRAVGRLPLGLLGLLGGVLVANATRVVLAVRGFGKLRYGGPWLRRGRWIVAGLLLYVALLTGPLGAARFLVPVWPLLLGLALAGLKSGHATDASGADEPSPVSEGQC